MDYNQALHVDPHSITESQAEEAYTALFFEGDSRGHLDFLPGEFFEGAERDRLINLLAEAALDADQVGKSAASDTLNKMRDLFIAFPSCEFSA